MSLIPDDFEPSPCESDQATKLEESERNRGIEQAHAIAKKIPKGEAGECDMCGDEFSRIVNGMCGGCRDIVEKRNRRLGRDYDYR
ncbi:hypothetical protein UFOVP138_6 [uncultured Caudovirales phage]|uniref:Conjugal transfer protein TraR n=1 Tax=uncultured Caudovirales phage TaxID=2100421 RepID=A0A6J5LFX9_9CAUD|nr:hypothetical protein UFOVP138_6 [uncultured Caudovirales phage]